MITVYLGLVYRYRFSGMLCSTYHVSIPVHKHICIFTTMSTNEPFSLSKKGRLIQSQPTVQHMFQSIPGLCTGLCTGEYGIVYTQYGYVNVP